MLEDLPDARERGVAGWIVNDFDEAWETVFFRPVGDGFEAVWAGLYDGSKVTRRTAYAPGERSLTAKEVALVQANLLLRKERVERCSAKPFNTVVIPTGKPDDGLYAYLLVPQETFETVPLGGHYRYEIVDGNFTSNRKFTISCLALRTDEQDGGKRPVSLDVTHLLDDTPTEIHVFSVFAAKLPIYVSTTSNDRMWAVEVSNGKPSIRIIR